MFSNPTHFAQVNIVHPSKCLCLPIPTHLTNIVIMIVVVVLTLEVPKGIGYSRKIWRILGIQKAVLDAIADYQAPRYPITNSEIILMSVENELRDIFEQLRRVAADWNQPMTRLLENLWR